MSGRKICISVLADTAQKFVENVREAAQLSGIIELRFDSLDDSQRAEVWPGLLEIRGNYEGTIIATFRSSENGQGGMAEISRERREDFWKSTQVRAVADWADVEEDISEQALYAGDHPAFDRTLRSFHSFLDSPTLEEVRKKKTALLSSLCKESSPIAKLAYSSEDITDSIGVWKILEDLPENEEAIAISMGDSGAWTRILGPPFGSRLTYAKLPDGEPAAPGQISFPDLKDLYRVEELDRSTAIYGIVGFPARHSISPYIHNSAFAYSGLNSVYLPLPVRDLEAFFRRMVVPDTREIGWNLKGLSITHPHKQRVMTLLDGVDANAASIGAVNTVRIEKGRLQGFNTDCEGFVRALKCSISDLKGVSAAIIGTGGAARAASRGLLEEGADVVIFSRESDRGPLELADFSLPVRPLDRAGDCFEGIDVLINATPQGSKGALENETPALAEQMQNLQLAFDMVYNPKDTRFLREAANAGIPSTGGIEMLIEQAMLQFEIWTGLPAPADVMRSAVAKLF